MQRRHGKKPIARAKAADAAYFDGVRVIAGKKGLNPLNRLNQVDLMAEFQEKLGFPPAPKLDVFGKLDPSKA